MSKFIISFLLGFSINAYAENPEKLFDTTHNMTNQSNIGWIQVKNPGAACDEISMRKGFGHFPKPVAACAFWDWDRNKKEAICTIYTGYATSMHILGHEVRHCFQGEFHKPGENEID